MQKRDDATVKVFWRTVADCTFELCIPEHKPAAVATTDCNAHVFLCLILKFTFASTSIPVPDTYQYDT